MSNSEQTSSHCSVHGHASDSSIKVGGYVSDSKQTSSHCSVHGHASDSSIKVGGYVSDSKQTSSHCSVHGHASDSSIKVGGYVSDSEQTSSHCSVHGHASDSSIKVGGYVSDSEQTSSHCSVHGHASDSSIKVGGYVSDSKQTSSHCSVHGHASDSSIKVGEYTADEEPSRPRWSSHGHASQSHFRLGKLLSNVEPFKSFSSDALSSIPEENTEPGTGPGAENETSEWARRGEQGALAQSAVLQRGLTAEQMEASVESLLCQGPPWGEREGWGPEWPREQAYLHSLAAQYQVEQYQDSYNLMRRQGVKLLSYLYNEAQNNCSNENYPVLLSLLKSSCEPYTRFIYDWVYSGVFRDVYREFMIQVNEDYLSFRDKHFWTQGYLLISKDVEDCVPVFLRHIANEIYISGKTINLLRVCCPRELEEIERDCGVYGGRMERIARYSAIKREEKALRTELARQELIVQVRETTAKALETVRGCQVSQRLAKEAKKRERFQELKQQLEVEQEGYLLISKDVEDCVPVFLRHIANKIYISGKTINLLRVCCPRHYICWSELLVPRIAVTFSLQELEEIERDCGVYRGRMERIARYSAIKREEKALRTELARQELIVQVRETTAKALETVRGCQVSQRLAKEAKKRERFQELKQQLEVEQERHWLETERNSFLQRQQSHIQTMLEKFPLGERREQLDIIPKGDSQRRLPAGGRGDSGEQGAQEILKPQSSDPRERPPALEAEPQESEKPTPDSVQEAPGDPLPHPTGPPELGEQEPQACSLDIHDFLPKETPDLPAGTSPVVSAVDAALLDICSELPEGASGLQQEYDFSAPYSPLKGARLRPRWNTHQHASQANIQLGQYASDVEPSTPRASVHGHVSKANIKVGQNVSEVQVAKPVVNVHGHSSESNIQLGQYASDMEQSTPRASVHRHVSEATIQLGDESKPTVHSKTLQAITEVSEGDPDPLISEPVLELHDQAPGVQLGEYVPVTELPGPTASVPGQASEENLNIMEKASEKELILPHVHIQGHASEEHIKLGGYMSDTEPSKPRVNIHGHASEGRIKVGEDVLDVDQVQPHLRIHGHASDSSIKVGDYVSDSEQTSSHCSVHGHASDSSIKVGGYMSDSEQTSSHCSVHGHASDSSIKVGGYVSDSKQTSSHCSVHGHASDSSIKVGGYVSDSEQTSSHCSVHGHASDSSIIG
ncbi:Gamma-tubulin complex component 6 [Acipenser ruthenus]|uniref:Gamma-tubulin complex component 6 n=1 Tax=Acipenser ruthenus TaxID=7906 RepID=A0A444V1F6_ACIRT|nr:Gamma-tubulin complex component 6 [Acipenser ruthenus]